MLLEKTLQESSKETIIDIRKVCDNQLLSFNQGDDDEFAIINHLLLNIDFLEQDLKHMKRDNGTNRYYNCIATRGVT